MMNLVGTSEKRRKRITRELNRLPFVRWDRFCIADDRTESIFGWIDRPQDAYKDFIVLYIDKDGGVDSYMTSSARYSLDIYKRLNDGNGRGHRNCRRVEHYFPAKGAIKLKA